MQITSTFCIVLSIIEDWFYWVVFRFKKPICVTFGIITDGSMSDRVHKIIDSIEALKINKRCYEIVIVGGREIHRKNVRWFPFDEIVKKAWITRKKNLIAQQARFDNVVLSHDYIAFDKDWYKAFCKFGTDWDVCMHAIHNQDGQRYRDWLLCPWFIDNTPEFRTARAFSQFLLPYWLQGFEKFQYISGSYFVVKKKVILDIPLDDRLQWGDGEDLVWSKEVLQRWEKRYVVNPNCKVRFLKQKQDNCWFPVSESTLRNFYYGEIPN